MNTASPFCRRIASAVAASLLVVCLSARAQAPMPIPIVPSPGLMVLAVLLQLALYGSAFSRADEMRVHELERGNDWKALAALADKRVRELDLRVSQEPESGTVEAVAPSAGAGPERAPEAGARAPMPRESLGFWLMVRAHAQRRLGDCAASIADYEAAARAGAKVPATGELERGQCEMSLARWEAAQRTMLRAAAADPAPWEPHYNLAVIRSVGGDRAGAQEALDALRARNPAAARSFEASFGALVEAQASGPERDAPGVPIAGYAVPSTGPELTRADSPGRLAASEMAIGGRALHLPPGAWLLVSRSASTIDGRPLDAGALGRATVDLVTGTAISAGGGFLGGVVVYEANRRRTQQLADWSAPACEDAEALFVDPFLRRFDMPECLTLRRIDAAALTAHPVYGAAAAFAVARGLRLHPAYYEVAYAGFGTSSMARIAVLRPVSHVPGALVARDWARVVADSVRTLADGRASAASLPP